VAVLPWPRRFAATSVPKSLGRIVSQILWRNERGSHCVSIEGRNRHAVGLPVLRGLSLCTCRRQYPGAAAGRNPRSSHPAVSAFPDSAVGSACTSTFSRLARRSLALRPAHSRGHQVLTANRRLQPFRYLHDCSDCFRRERIAGWALHPLESAAFSRRTPEAVACWRQRQRGNAPKRALGCPPWREVEHARRDAVAGRAAPAQRHQAEYWWNLAADVDSHPARSRTGRDAHSNDPPEQPAASGISTVGNGALAIRTGVSVWSVGTRAFGENRCSGRSVRSARNIRKSDGVTTPFATAPHLASTDVIEITSR
jgi:hypothetical protein